MSRKTLKKFEKTLDRPVEVCYNGRKAPERPRFRTSLLHFGARAHHFCTSLSHFGAGGVRGHIKNIRAGATPQNILAKKRGSLGESFARLVSVARLSEVVASLGVPFPRC